MYIEYFDALQKEKKRVAYFMSNEWNEAILKYLFQVRLRAEIWEPQAR